MSGIERERLLQALEHFNNRTKGEEQPEGTKEAIEGLLKALGAPAPGRDTPGAREALKVAPGTDGTGAHFSRAAMGVDGPSPGQKEAQSVSAQIKEAAAAIAAKGAGQGRDTPTEGT